MNFFSNINKKDATTELVKRGLANQDAVSSKEIRGIIYLLESALGDTWKNATSQAAAGMVLMSLAKNRALSQVLNSCGWKLVLGLVQSTPRIERDISSGKRAEIHHYQSGMTMAMA